MEIVRIFSNTPKYTLQRKKLLSKHGMFHREICPCIRESRGGWGYVPITDEYTGRKQWSYPSKTYAPFALDRGERSKGEIWPIEISTQWVNTERERERDAGGNYARYIFPPSRVIGIPEAHASHAPPRRADNLCFGTGMIRFATTSPVVVVQM